MGFRIVDSESANPPEGWESEGQLWIGDTESAGHSSLFHRISHISHVTSQIPHRMSHIPHLTSHISYQLFLIPKSAIRNPKSKLRMQQATVTVAELNSW